MKEGALRYLSHSHFPAYIFNFPSIFGDVSLTKRVLVRVMMNDARRTLILWNFTKTYTQNKSNTFDLVIASFLNADIGITKNCCAKSRIGLKLMALRLWKEKNQREGVSSTCKNDSDLDWGEVQFQFLLG